MKNIYVASCTKTGGIYHFKLINGLLQLYDIVKMDSPMYMAVENGRMYIILKEPLANGESAVVTYDIAEDGKLINPSDMLPTMGVEACHLSVKNGAVYCANYASGSIVKLPDRLVLHEGSGPDPLRQEQAHTHFIGFAPDGQYLCAADLGLDTVFVYDPDLNLVSQASVPSGHGVRHLVFSQDGKYLFAANELVSGVSAFAYEDRKLTLLDTQSCLPNGYTGESYAAAIRLCGEKILVSNRGHDSIAVLSFDGEHLRLEGCSACGGHYPRDFIVLDDLLICTNQLSGDVTVLKKQADGGYTVTQTIPVDTAIAVLAAE